MADVKQFAKTAAAFLFVFMSANGHIVLIVKDRRFAVTSARKLLVVSVEDQLFASMSA